jgi:hypothetical protein
MLNCKAIRHRAAVSATALKPIRLMHESGVRSLPRSVFYLNSSSAVACLLSAFRLQNNLHQQYVAIHLHIIHSTAFKDETKHRDELVQTIYAKESLASTRAVALVTWQY